MLKLLVEDERELNSYRTVLPVSVIWAVGAKHEVIPAPQQVLARSSTRLPTGLVPQP
jgi:hypothetical protein